MLHRKPPDTSRVSLIKGVLVAGNRVVVRGEVSGTPAGDLFGVAHTGKSFRIIAIDIQTVQDGKISRTYHLENWISAVGELRARGLARWPWVHRNA